MLLPKLGGSWLLPPRDFPHQSESRPTDHDSNSSGHNLRWSDPALDVVIKLFEDPVIAETIVDRLIHPCQKITLKREKSYREKLQEKKSGLKNQGGLL